MDDAEQDVLAYMTFPQEHRTKLHSINPIERINGEIKRRTDVVGICPNDNAIVCLVGALLLEQNDEWAVQRTRYATKPLRSPSGSGRIGMAEARRTTFLLCAKAPSAPAIASLFPNRAIQEFGR